jgi:integrase
MIEREAAAAPQPHMVRHACRYALANKGRDTRAIQGRLDHWSITGTTVSAPCRRCWGRGGPCGDRLASLTR